MELHIVETINILHVSDFHIRTEDERDIKDRFKALFRDIERLEIPIHIVAVTGDIAYHGKPEEYELAENLFFSKLSSNMNIKRSNIIVTPGNHDIARDQVDPVVEAGLQSIIVSPSVADKYIAHESSIKRLSSFINFSKKYGNPDSRVWYTREITVNGLTISFTCLNSSWRCSKDNEDGSLFLGEQQVIDSSAKLDHNLRIALLHHTPECIHPAEADTIANLKNRFDMVFTGHLHKVISIGEQTPHSDCLLMTAPAIYSSQSDLILEYIKMPCVRLLLRQNLSFTRNSMIV